MRGETFRREKSSCLSHFSLSCPKPAENNTTRQKNMSTMASSSFIAVAIACLLTPFGSAFQAPHSTTQTRSHYGKAPLCAEKTATFGMGCFWAPSEDLLKVDGVVDTVAGYTGNPEAKKPPTYDNVCYGRQWVEGVRVTYDDSKLSYDQLLDAFFETQNPDPRSRQYSSMIFYSSEEEKKAAETWLSTDRVRKDGISTKWTNVEASSPFFMAEGYHQRYWQKMRPRAAVGLLLIAIGTGVLDRFVPVDFQQTVQTFGNAGVLVGCLYILLERKIDAKVVELQ